MPAKKGYRNTMMKLLIDTNVIIDYLADRASFAEHSEKIIELCADGEVKGFLSASSVTDIYYILRKTLGKQKAREGLRALLDAVNIADVGRKDLLGAMELEMADFEDALVSVCAKRNKAAYIVTRNVKDFSGSSVEAITPKDLLKRFFPYLV